ncbi:MAG TPA: TolC family protein [Bacteroidales bacterium]|nr:TolC family protein [Bacteroidales bacterium]
MNRFSLLFFAAFLFTQVTFAQYNDSLRLSLSLRNIVDLAISQSASVKYVQNTNVNYYWRWKNFRTSFRPQLVLSGNLPNYFDRPDAITLDDGSIDFVFQKQMNANAQISLNQSIPQTNTYIWAGTDLYRNQDFKNGQVKFSGAPYEIGIYQPIFAYNYMKWQRKTEPLVHEESGKQFNQSIEEIAYESTRRFFKYLRIQTNYNLAASNLKNSQDNLRIAETKQKLGKISENDFARIKLSVLNAQKALSNSKMELNNADFELKSYVNLDLEQKIDLSIPLDMILFDIDPQKALAEAKENRKETPLFQRRLIEANSQLVKAKRSTGLSATLSGSIGVSNVAYEYQDIYKEPEPGRSLKLSMSIPILDWGRSASTVKLAESQRELVIYGVERDKEDFERSIIVQVEQFSLLKEQLNTAREADKVAENGYLIALKKFQSGEISITDLNISLAERESAKRDYISSIETYWLSYYRLRILTLYDFELNQKIQYTNPMLDKK